MTNFNLKLTLDITDQSLEFLINISRSLVDKAVCGGYFSFNSPNGEKYYMNAIFAEYLKMMSPRDWFSQQSALLNGAFTPTFSETFNRRGSTFSFNLNKAEDLLRFER